MNETNNKIVLVTGASRGLGYQVALLLGKKGFHIIGLGRTVGRLEKLSDTIAHFKGTSTMVPINLENDDEIERLAASIYERWKKIDIFIHCAVISTPMSPVTLLSIKDFEKSFAINTRSTLKLIQMFDPLLRISKTKTAIFLDDKNSGKFLSTYSSAKASTREIIKSYQEESKRIGTKVIIFNPKPMPTKLRARFYPGENRQKLSSCKVQAKKLIITANL